MVAMRYSALAAPLVLACPLFAQESPASAPTKLSPAASASTTKAMVAEAKAQAYISLHKKTYQIFRQLGALIDEVDDRESADAAAPQVARLTDAFAKAMGQVEALGNPPPDVEAALLAYMSRREEEIEAVADDVVAPVVQLLLDSPACYGSEALAAELTRMLGSLRDAAWHEEEVVTGCEGDDEDPSAGEADGAGADGEAADGGSGEVDEADGADEDDSAELFGEEGGAGV